MSTVINRNWCCFCHYRTRFSFTHEVLFIYLYRFVNLELSYVDWWSKSPSKNKWNTCVLEVKLNQEGMFFNQRLHKLAFYSLKNYKFQCLKKIHKAKWMWSQGQEKNKGHLFAIFHFWRMEEKHTLIKIGSRII